MPFPFMPILRRISVTLLVRGLSAVASLGLAALITAAYSLAKFGEFSFALMSVKMAAGLALFSVHAVLLKLLLRGEFGAQRTGRTRIIRECGGIATLLSFIAVVSILTVIALVLQIFGESGFWLSLVIVLPILPLQNIAIVQSCVLRAQRRDAVSQIITIGIPTIFPAILVGAGIAAGYTPRFLPEFATLGSSALAAMIGIIMARTAPFMHLLSGTRALLHGRWRLLRHSWTPHLANIMNYLSDWYGSALIAATQSMELTGALRIIQQFGNAFQLLMTSVETPLSTEIGRAHLNRNYTLADRMLRQSQMLLGGAGIALALAAAIFSGPILGAFQANIAQVQLALIIYMAFQAGRMMAGASASALFLMDASRWLIRASTIALILTALVQSAMIPFFGIIGAAIGLGAGVLARAAINYIYARREISQKLAAQV